VLPISTADVLVVALQSGIVPRGTRVQVFDQIYTVFLVLGTIVSIVVMGYMLVNAYKYRAGSKRAEKADVERPELGEIPQGGGGGKKLFLSFSLSAIIVISLIVWTYGTLLYVEANPPVEDPANQENTVVVKVVGHQFFWEYVYQDVPGHEAGVSVNNNLRVPEGAAVKLVVTSADVFHNYGVPSLRVKSDAIPGQTTETWFIADQVGRYPAHCYELCGVGHSFMDGNVTVMEQSDFDQWYDSQNASA